MELLTDLFYALVLAGLPLMALSFAMIWWAMSRGRLQGKSVGELQRGIKAIGKAREKREEKTLDESIDVSGDDLWGLGSSKKNKPKDDEKLDPVLDKWFAFGGGFYGLVAVYTWIILAWNDLWEFLGGVFDIIITLDPGQLIALAIDLFMDSLMDFITAIAWPMYWFSVAGNPWLWIGVAYGGYWLGMEAARRVVAKGDRSGEADLTEVITGREDDPG